MKQDEEEKEQHRRDIKEYFLGRVGNCSDLINPRRKTQCSCLKTARGEMNDEMLERYAKAILEFTLCEKNIQKNILLQWITYANKTIHDKKRLGYLLPGTSCHVCRDALFPLLGIGATCYRGLLDLSKSSAVVYTHGLADKNGNRGKKRDIEAQDDVVCYLEQLCSTAEPVTSSIHYEFSTETNEVTRTIKRTADRELPPHFTKRDFFLQYTTQRGYRCTLGPRGGIKDVSPSRDEVEGNVVSQSEFTQYWDDNFSDLKIAILDNGICKECSLYTHNHVMCCTVENSTSSRREQSLSIMSQMTNHMSDVQRSLQLYDSKVKECEDRSNRVVTLVLGYSRNMHLPNPYNVKKDHGYVSTLDVYGLGVLDKADGRVTLYVYSEETGRKGGSYLVSALYFHLRQGNYLSGDCPMHEFNIFVDDSCVGTDNLMLRFLTWIVKRRFAKSANLHHLPSGHANNELREKCEAVWEEWRAGDAFTLNEIKSLLEQATDVQIVVSRAIRFIDWSRFLEVIDPKPSKSIYRHYYVCNDDSNNIRCTDDVEENGEICNAVSKLHWGKDESWWFNLGLPGPMLPRPNLAKAKLKDLYFTWGQKILDCQTRFKLRYYNENPLTNTSAKRQKN